LEVHVKRFLRKVIPAPVRRRLTAVVRDDVGPLRKAHDTSLSYEERFPHRNDVRRFDLGGGVELAVFWKVLPIGRGPAFSLHVGRAEPLKVDCFGLPEGHYHMEAPTPDGTKDDRIRLPEPTRRAQVERAIFEIERNGRYFLERSRFPEARKATPDPARVAAACAEAREVALRFLDTIPELAEAGPRAAAE
jgi:hypothetical protein